MLIARGTARAISQLSLHLVALFIRCIIFSFSQFFTAIESSMKKLTLYAKLLCMPLAQAAWGTGVPVDGFLPQVGITLTDEFIDDFSFMPVASSQPEGNYLGFGSPVYEVALLDTGAAVSLVTPATNQAFNLNGMYPGNNDGYRGTEFITIGGASGFLDAEVNDVLGLYAGGLQDRTSAGSNLQIGTTALEGQTNTAIITTPIESDLPNVLGLPFASQYATRIRNSLPQIFEVNGQTVRSPAIDFHPLGSAGLGITRKAQLFLEGASPSNPLHFPNLVNFDIDRPWENPSQPTVVQGGHFLNANFSNDGANLSSQFFFDTGASVTVLSQFKALEMGFDVTLDEPEFTISILGSGGTLSDVPGFFVDQITIPALGGSLTVNNVPVIVLDVTNVAAPGNVVDGIIGTNIFQGRDIVIDPNPSLGGGGASPGVYISDPVTNDANWATPAATASWQVASSWSNSTVPDTLSIANVRHVAGGNQQANLIGNAQVFEVNVSGGTSGETMTLNISGGAMLTTFSGTNIEQGGIVLLDGTLDTQYVDIREDGMLSGRGSIFTGSGTIDGQVENVAGTIAPSDAAGVGVGQIEIEGRLSNSTDGTLQFDIGGLDPESQHDQILIDGSVALAGTLEVVLAPGFQPKAGDRFTLIAQSDLPTSEFNLAGEFETFLLPDVYNWGIDYNADSVELFVGSPGDFNHDGTVDVADYTVWRDGLGNRYTIGNYNRWKSNFGTIYPAMAAVAGGPNAAVPEPASGLLLAMLLGGLAYLRPRHSGGV